MAATSARTAGRRSLRAGQGGSVRTVNELWPNEGLPASSRQILPQPAHFEQTSALVTEELIDDAVPCGPDVESTSPRCRRSRTRASTHLFVQQVGARQQELFDVLSREILPRFA